MKMKYGKRKNDNNNNSYIYSNSFEEILKRTRRSKMKKLSIIFGLLLIFGLTAGCSSSGEDVATLPSGSGPEGGTYNGDQPEPPIPTPYAELAGLYVCDMEWELDGDLVVSTPDGLFLFTPYGVLKRTYPEIGCISGLANNDTGRGMSYFGPGTGGNPAGMDDDKYVSDGHNTTTFDARWFSGDPNPIPDFCDLTITMQWMLSQSSSPAGYVYHPHSGRTYIKLNSGGVWIGDDECETDWHPDIGSTVDPGALFGTPVGDVILSYDQMAPFPPDIWFTGPPDEPNDPAGDWVVYVPYDVYNSMQMLAGVAPGYQRMANTARVFSVNGTDPPSPIPPARDGLSVVNVGDFDMDSQGRMVAAVSASDAYIITKPIVDGEHIIVERVIGGRMNGMGTGPGEFQGPTGVAIDPITQNHIVSDSGNNRIQIFTSQGDYIRQFLTGPNPRKALHDSWGNLLVATDNGLEIYNEQGSQTVYGSIEGFVQDKESGLPLENAYVYIVNTFDLPVQSDYTSEEGYFSMYAVPAGTHNLVVSKVAYFDTSSVVDVSAGIRTDVNFYMSRVPVSSPGTGNVSGTFIKSGSPLEGGGLGISGLTVGVEGLGVSDITNGNGEFMLIGVDTGPQKLQVSRNGNIIYEKNIQVPDGQTLDTGIVYLYV